MKYFSTKNERKATIGTILVHLALLLAFLFFALSVPLPLPEEEGIIVNLGSSESGQGDSEAKTVSKEVTKPQLIPQTKVQTASETVKSISNIESKTQTTEESANITKESVKTIEKTPETPVVEQRKPNPLANYKPSAKSADNTGTGSGGSNNTGTGSGSGTKAGQGTGSGGQGGQSAEVSGKGVSFKLNGRTIVEKPVVNDFKEAGKIVVEIIVDRNGKVVSARAGLPGTTISNQDQQEVARKAALKAQFSPNQDAEIHQIGTVTFNYSFN